MEKSSNLNLLRHSLVSEIFAKGKALVIDRLPPDEQIFAQIPQEAEQSVQLGRHTAVANTDILAYDRLTLQALQGATEAATFIFYLPPVIAASGEEPSYEEIAVLLFCQLDSPVEFCYFQTQFFTARHYGMHKNIKNRSDDSSQGLHRVGAPDVSLADMQSVLNLLKIIEKIKSDS